MEWSTSSHAQWLFSSAELQSRRPLQSTGFASEPSPSGHRDEGMSAATPAPDSGGGGSAARAPAASASSMPLGSTPAPSSVGSTGITPFMAELDPSARAGAAEQLGADDEASLRRHFEVRAQQLCAILGRAPSDAPQSDAWEKVAATAVMYLKRFRTKYSIVDPKYEPSAMLLAAVYTATKVEEMWEETVLDRLLEAAKQQHVGADGARAEQAALGGDAPAQKQRVVEAEMQLLTAMDFQLVLFHPQSEVQGALQQYKQWCAGHSRRVGESQVHMLQRGAAKHLRNAMRSDAPLLYPPAALSLAALSLAADALPDTERGGSSGGSSAPSFQDFISEMHADRIADLVVAKQLVAKYAYEHSAERDCRWCGIDDGQCQALLGQLSKSASAGVSQSRALQASGKRRRDGGAAPAAADEAAESGGGKRERAELPGSR